jgi:hypothetical protein
MDWIASALARLAMTRNTNIPPVPGAMQRHQRVDARLRRAMAVHRRTGTVASAISTQPHAVESVASVTAPAQRRTTRVLRRVRGMHTRYLSFVIASGAKQSRRDLPRAKNWIASALTHLAITE